MREYILTPREREILKTYIESGIKLNGFSVLALRLKRASKILLDDTEIVKAALDKLNKEANKK